MQEPIQNFIGQNPRNKLIITPDKLDDINYLNVGYELAKTLKESKLKSHFALRAKNKLNNLLDNRIEESKYYSRYLALTNLGILLEPELKLDLVSLLDGYSRDYPVFIHWNGKIEHNTLYFLDNKGLKIGLNHISHLII